MFFCRRRANAEELQDRLSLSPDVVRAGLRDLETVNRYLGGARAILSHIGPALEATRGEGELRVLDIACGGGGILGLIAGRARRQGATLAGVGIDINPTVLAYAKEKTKDLPELAWMQGDALRLPFPERSFDLVTCATFLHHLEPESAVEVLRQARAVSRGWLIVSDLMRSCLGSLLFRAFAELAGFHPASRHDGVVSLLRSYTPAELRELAEAAALDNCRLYRHPFWRMTLVSGPG